MADRDPLQELRSLVETAEHEARALPVEEVRALGTRRRRRRHAAVAGGVLRQIAELGWDHPLGELCFAQLEKIRAIDAQHPRLEPLEVEYLAMRRKYGIS